ncbi:PQQ-binding-like beta-propeller repeat protein, partial [Candidatus Bathyarchaeota archaeon]|nr:PQQ-binding-like beta-propeller repeat protein [Candidatus Bathyarchaeota archaeon]
MLHHDSSHKGYSISPAPVTNTTLWSYSIGSWGVGSSPTIVNGRLYVCASDNNMYCLNAGTGAKIWNYTIGYPTDSSPAVVNGRVYIGSGAQVYCLNASTGSMIWSYTTGNAVWSSPAVVDGKVYIGSLDKNVYCLDAVNGTKIWNYNTGMPVFSS